VFNGSIKFEFLYDIIHLHRMNSKLYLIMLFQDSHNFIPAASGIINAGLILISAIKKGSRKKDNGHKWVKQLI